jgi:hypothetical protein
LFTNIHVADVSRIWESSGRGDRHPHTAARTTFWNIDYEGGQFNYRQNPAQAYPPYWVLLNVIGIKGLPEKKDSSGIWIEPIEVGVYPEDLYQTQLQRRLEK